MNHEERMLAGLPYKAWLDGLAEKQIDTKMKIYAYNLLPPNETAQIEKSIRNILGKAGVNINVLAPFRCDYGTNIEIGDNFFANYNCIIIDVGRVTIGDNVMFGPNVSLYTAGHPLHPESRNSGYEYGIGIAIKNNVWIGGNTVINPGITIGENTVIGSGSVVTKDMPANVIAAGNPCRVIRSVTDEDRHFFHKNKKFDVSDY
jgi:acetyltransferase-like isoleucine patch superfamily enzyme